MQLYDAMITAAGFIERHPKQYNFHTCFMPMSLDKSGCVLGWIGYFSGRPALFDRGSAPGCFPIASELFGMGDPMTFYHKMCAAVPHRDWYGWDWTRDAALAAKALREYADQYAPAQGG